MTDQEKLEKLTELIAEVACGTTYNYPGGRGFAINTKEIAHHLIANGVTVREPQKPLTYDEFCGNVGVIMYLEYAPNKLMEYPMLLTYCGHFYAEFDEIGRAHGCDLELNNYGSTWRCWAEKPTDEERKAAEWDG